MKIEEYAKQAIHNTFFSQSVSSDHRTRGSPGARGFHEFRWTLKFCRTRLTHGRRLNSQRSMNIQEVRSPGRNPAPQPMPFYIVSMMSVVWNISIGHLASAAWLCSLLALVHLLGSLKLETGKSPWFLWSNWKYQCITNILLILNAKHNSYWKEN